MKQKAIKKLKKDRKILFFLAIFLFITLIIMSAILFYSFKTFGFRIAEESIKTNIRDYKQCSNFSLFNTTYCLQNYIKSFVNYTVRTDFPKSHEDIKKNGGDCYDYSLLYESMARELGFKAYTVKFKTEENISHQIAIITNEEGYCIADITEIFCVNFK